MKTILTDLRNEFFTSQLKEILGFTATDYPAGINIELAADIPSAVVTRNPKQLEATAPAVIFFFINRKCWILVIYKSKYERLRN